MDKFKEQELKSFHGTQLFDAKQDLRWIDSVASISGYCTDLRNNPDSSDEEYYEKHPEEHWRRNIRRRLSST